MNFAIHAWKSKMRAIILAVYAVIEIVVIIANQPLFALLFAPKPIRKFTAYFICRKIGCICKFLINNSIFATVAIYSNSFVIKNILQEIFKLYTFNLKLRAIDISRYLPSACRRQEFYVFKRAVFTPHQIIDKILIIRYRNPRSTDVDQNFVRYQIFRNNFLQCLHITFVRFIALGFRFGIRQLLTDISGQVLITGFIRTRHRVLEYFALKVCCHLFRRAPQELCHIIKVYAVAIGKRKQQGIRWTFSLSHFTDCFHCTLGKYVVLFHAGQLLAPARTLKFYLLQCHNHSGRWVLDEVSGCSLIIKITIFLNEAVISFVQCLPQAVKLLLRSLGIHLGKDDSVKCIF